MKIFDNTGSGGGGSYSGGSNVEPGDIVLSSITKTFDPTSPTFQNDKWFDLSFSNYISDYEDTDISNNQVFQTTSPQFVTFKKSSTFNVSNNAQITRLEDGRFLFTCYNGPQNQFYNIGISKKGFTPDLVTIEIPEANFYSSLYDYNNTVYIYRNSVFSKDSLMTNTIYKVNLTTLEYETITINNKRICKAYYDKERNKYITHEFNNINEDDQTSSKGGIFVSDDFENTSTVATFQAIANNTQFAFRTITESVTNIANAMLYTTDGNFLIYYKDEKQLKKFVNGASTVILDVLDKTGGKINIVDQTMLLEYDLNYFLCYNHKITDTSKYKTWVRVKTDGSESPEYCFCETLKDFDINNGLILKDVYNTDFENPELPAFGYAIVYQNTDVEKRKVTTFRNSYTFEDVNTINDGGNNWFFINYFYNVNYNEIFNGGEQLIIDNFGTLNSSIPSDGNITNFKFNGYGLPGIYIQKIDQLETAKYFLRVKK